MLSRRFFCGMQQSLPALLDVCTIGEDNSNAHIHPGMRLFEILIVAFVVKCLDLSRVDKTFYSTATPRTYIEMSAGW